MSRIWLETLQILPFFHSYYEVWYEVSPASSNPFPRQKINLFFVISTKFHIHELYVIVMSRIWQETPQIPSFLIQISKFDKKFLQPDPIHFLNSKYIITFINSACDFYTTILCIWGGACRVNPPPRRVDGWRWEGCIFSIISVHLKRFFLPLPPPPHPPPPPVRIMVLHTAPRYPCLY